MIIIINNKYTSYYNSIILKTHCNHDMYALQCTLYTLYTLYTSNVNNYTYQIGKMEFSKGILLFVYLCVGHMSTFEIC